MLIIREFAVSDLHFTTVFGLRTDLGGCKIPKFSGVGVGGGGGCPRGSSYKRSVPMLCPSNGDVLATPQAIISMLLHTSQEHMINIKCIISCA